MKTLLRLKSAISKSYTFSISALVLLVPVIFPELALASELKTLGLQGPVFEIKITNPNFLDQSPKQNEQTFLTMKELEDNDPLVSSLREYLENLHSPLDIYAADIVKQPQWQRALAISWVESNMGKHCYDNNCSGIGVKPGHPAWRKYKTKLDWFVDLCVLLEKPIYKEKYTTFKQMRGVYVVPGSDAWVYGSQQKFNELVALTQNAETTRQAKAQELVALATFPENLE